MIKEDSIFEVSTGGVNPWAEDSSTTRVQYVQREFGEELGQNEEFVNPDDQFEETGEEQEPLSEEIIADVGEFGEDEVEDDKNLHALLTAKKLQEDGFLPNDIEFDDSTDYPQIYEALKGGMGDRMRSEIAQEINSNLASVGITPENISLLQAIENQIPVEEISAISRYKKYANLPVDDVEEDKKMSVIKEMFSIRGLTEKEIDRQITAIEMSGDVDSEFETAQSFFKQTSELFDRQQEEILADRFRQEAEARERNQEILKKAITRGEIGTEKLSKEQAKELERAIYEKSVVLEIGDQKYPASQFEEFLYNVNNSFEFQLLMFKAFKYRGKELEVLKARAAEEETRGHWDALKEHQGKSGTKGSVKRGDGSAKAAGPLQGTYIEF